jgi:HD-GYP domain-containing protein (c-di-GMP phosphodiesterase class II)
LAAAGGGQRPGQASQVYVSKRGGKALIQSSVKAGVDRERVHAAQQMLTAFFVLAKTARVYETGNESYQSQLTRFNNLLGKYMQDYHNCSIKLVSDRLFVDEQFVNIDSDERIGVRLMTERWQELGIGGMVFGDSVTPEHITILIRLLSNFSAAKGNPCEQFNYRLAEEEVDSIVVMPEEKLDPGQLIDIEDRQKLRQEARQTFFRAVATVKEIMSRASKQETLSVARTKRIIHNIIDQVSDNASALMELASIKNFDDYTYAHSVNVSIYSLSLGFRIGLNRKELSELGFASLFHDIGKVKLSHDLVTKADRYDEFDWTQMHQHPILGAMTIAKTLHLNSHMARAMSAAYEHHVNPDNTGYPILPDPRPTSLFSRIISIADNFDALTSGRVYIKEEIPATEVMRKMMYQMSVKFDTFLLKLFVNIIGIYPVGSLVLLSDNSFGIVTRANLVENSRPELRLIADNTGPLSPPQWCDLADSANRAIDIIRVIDPNKYNIDLTGYILSD